MLELCDSTFPCDCAPYRLYYTYRMSPETAKGTHILAYNLYILATALIPLIPLISLPLTGPDKDARGAKQRGVVQLVVNEAVGHGRELGGGRVQRRAYDVRRGAACEKKNGGKRGDNIIGLQSISLAYSVMRTRAY